MNFGSICSGIEAASAGWLPLGWECAFMSEIEPFPCAVLKHHYPETPNYGDITKYKSWPVQPINVLVGGTPCQSFSVAGLRKGLADPRGNLALTFLAIAARYAPTWIVWENVPGVFSIDEGRVFGSFLGGLAQLGYGFAYRILDAQFFGVPQRRRRVFVVGHSGGQWQRAAAVLFERESLCGNNPPRREAGKGVAVGVANSLGGSSQSGGFRTTDLDNQGAFLPIAASIHGDPREHKGGSNPTEGHFVVAASSTGNGYWTEGAGTLRAREQESHEHLVAHSLSSDGFDASEDGTGRGTPLVPETAPTLDQRSGRSGESSFATSGGLVPEVSPAIKARDWKGPSSDGDGDGSPLIPVAFRTSGNCGPFEQGDKTGALNTATDPNQNIICFDTTQITSPGNFSNPKLGDPSHPLATGQHPPSVAVGIKGTEVGFTLRSNPSHSGDKGDGGVNTTLAVQKMSVRRLTPKECERLQGFPDDWTLIEYHGKPACDDPRYKALGNSMAVPVMRWIGERISKVQIL